MNASLGSRPVVVSLAPFIPRSCLLAPPHGAADNGTIAIHKQNAVPPAGSIARRLLPWSDRHATLG